MADTLSGWKKKHTKFHSGELAVYHEKITRGTTVSDSLGTEIDFIPPGVDFLVGMKPSAALSTGTDLAIYASPTSGGTFSLLKDDLVAIGAAATQTFGQFDVSANGEMPYYKCFLDGDATNIKNFDIYVSFIIP